MVWRMISMDTPCSANSWAILCQHARLVGNVEADVVARVDGVDGQRGNVADGGLGLRRAAQDNPAGGGDEVAQDGRRRRGSAGALAVEHQLAGVLGFDEHGVERAVDGRQRVLARQQRGVHADGDALAAVGGGQFLRDGQELDDEPGVLGRGDIRTR